MQMISLYQFALLPKVLSTINIIRLTINNQFLNIGFSFLEAKFAMRFDSRTHSEAFFLRAPHIAN